MTLETTPEVTKPNGSVAEVKDANQGGGRTEAHQIPKARFDQVNVKLKDAQKQIAELNAKLAEVSGTPVQKAEPTVDLDAFAEEAARVAAEIAEQKTAALRQELEFKTRIIDVGLTAKQASLVQENQTKYGMDFETALRFARSEHQKEFAGMSPSTPFGGQFRSGGQSPLREGEPKPDLAAAAAKARANGNVDPGVNGSSHEIAAEMFRQRIAPMMGARQGSKR